MIEIKNNFSESLLELVPMGICVVNLSTEIICYTNASLRNLFGKGNEDLQGLHYIDALGEEWAIPDRSSPTITKRIIMNMVPGMSLEVDTETASIDVTYDLREAGQDKLIIWVRVAGEVNLEATANNGVAANVTRDIATKSFEELTGVLKESADDLAAAFDAAELASCGIDLVTGQVNLSERARDFFGLPLSGDVSWEDLLSAVDPVYHNMVNKAFSDCLEHGTPVDSTYSIKHLISGETRWMHVIAKVHFALDGSPLKVYGIVMDITKEKMAEERKNQFIAIVSHDLKIPLSAISGYIQILQRKFDNTADSLVSSLLDKTLNQSKKMTRLINGFLNSSRLEAGKITLKSEQFSLTSLLNELEEDAQNLITSHQVSIRKGGDITVVGDRDKLHQVFTNMISNAVKYSAAGTSITVSYDKIGDELQVQVVDQGVGMTIEDQKRVFDRFFRVNSKAVDSLEGFGIGLYICREIIEQHGGSIAVDSEFGVGTTFTFRIPLL